MTIKKIFISLVIFLISVLTVIGTYDNAIILFGDTDLTYYFGKYYFSFDKIFVWNDYYQSGLFDYFRFQGFFIKKFIYIINVLINNLYLFSYLWFFVPYVLFITSFYLFINQFLTFTSQSVKKNWLIAIVLSLFAFFNGIIIIYAGQTLFLVSLVFLNLFLLFFLKNIDHIQKKKKNNYIYIIIMAFVLSESLIYVQISILLFYTFVAIFPFAFKFIRKHLKQLVIQGILLALLCFLYNASWTFPLAYHFLKSNISYTDLSLYDVDLALRQAKSVSSLVYMYELLRQKSYHLYNNVPWVVYLATSVPIYIFVIELIKRRKDSILIALMSVYLLFILFSYGIHSTTSRIFLFFWDYVPLFNTFRTIMKFSIVNLYVIIIALTYILSRSQNKKFIIYISAILLCTISGYSYFAQEQFKNSFQQYTIPDYYFDLEKNYSIIQKGNIANRVYLPQTNWQTQYDWAPKDIDGMNILPFFLGPGNLVNGAQYLPDPAFIFNDYFQYLFKFNSIADLKYALGLRNIDTIVFQNDVRFSSNKQENEKRKIPLNYVLDIFKNNNLCKNVEQSGEIFFCKIQDEFFMPIISPKNNLISVKYQKDIDIMPIQTRVLIDLQSLKISTDNDSVIFEDTFESYPKVSKKVYFGHTPQIIENCISNTLPCDKFTIKDLPSDTYSVYFKHYPFSYLSAPVKKKHQVLFTNTSSKSNSSKTQILDILVQPESNNSYLGDISVNEGTLEIQTDSNEYFNNGSFYLTTINNQPSTQPKLPIIEFKKINPTYYRVVVHQAPKTFILQFLSNFHEGWKLFAIENPLFFEPKNNPKLLTDESYSANYDQASNKEINTYIENRILKYPPKSNNSKKFISKKIQNSIQNDNISDKTQNLQKYELTSHIKTLDYANAWILTKSEICKKNTCTMNADGTYDAEFTIEFGPQRYARIGLIISIAAFTASVIFIFTYWIYRKIRK